MEHFLRARHWLPGPAIVILTVITLAVVIRLQFVGGATQSFL